MCETNSGQSCPEDREDCPENYILWVDEASVLTREEWDKVISRIRKRKMENAFRKDLKEEEENGN